MLTARRRISIVESELGELGQFRVQVRSLEYQGSGIDTYGILMIAVLVWGTLFGGLEGLAREVGSPGANLASYYGAFHLRDPGAEQSPTTPPWDVFIAMLLLYVGT